MFSLSELNILITSVSMKIESLKTIISTGDNDGYFQAQLEKTEQLKRKLEEIEQNLIR